MDAAKLLEAKTYAESKQGAGLIVRRGYQVYSWGIETDRFPVASVTKGVGAILLGVANSKLGVKVDDKAKAIYPQFAECCVPHDDPSFPAEVSIEQLATHSSGFTNNRADDGLRIKFRPGTVWLYSDGGANWLADVLTFRFGDDLRNVLKTEVLDHLGITLRTGSGQSGDMEWRAVSATDPRGPTIGTIPRREFNAGISINVRAMARLGLLVERDGNWNGTQILRPEYVTALRKPSPIIAGLPIVDTGGQSHEGDFPGVTAHHGLFWFNNADKTLPNVPEDAFWTWGAGDHLIVVIPSLQLVIARTSGTLPAGDPPTGGPAPWDRNPPCISGTWCAHYNVLELFLTPIVQAIRAEPLPPPAAPTVTLTSSAASVTTGGTVVLTWSSTLATSCTASNGWSGAKATAGTETVTVSQTATYVLDCTGAGGTTQASVGVTANPPAQNPPPPPPPADNGGGGGGGALQWWMLASLLLVGGGRKALAANRRRRACLTA